MTHNLDQKTDLSFQRIFPAGKSSQRSLIGTFTIYAFFTLFFLFGDIFGYENIPLGQRVLPKGMLPPRERIRNILGGFYSQNVTLFFRNSPYRVQSEIIVESGAVMTIETGVQMYFDTGVGMKIFGQINAIGNEFAHIQMLPYQEQTYYDHSFPEFRLIDGPTVRQGRLQVRFRDRWRSICTQLTNWTSLDTGAACRSIGYTDGGFWRYYRRNNDTYPFVMPIPKCHLGAENLWKCEGFSDLKRIPLTENLCQGEDDLGLYCWGPPTYKGWAKHWKGIQIFNSPFRYVLADPDMVSMQRESMSRLEFIDILYAGYDGLTKNTTAALYVEGVPPIMNGLRVEHSARDGISFYESEGPIIIANSTIGRNRGHGIIIDNTMDGRFFLNQSIVYENYGDGIWYKQYHSGMSSMADHWGDKAIMMRKKRHNNYVERERARLDMCVQHRIPRDLFFPHLIRAHLQNGTVADSQLANICWLSISLPSRLRYSYTMQFIKVENRNPANSDSTSDLVICDGNSTFAQLCQRERYRIPIQHNILPQSVTLTNIDPPLLLSIEHHSGNGSNTVLGDVDLLFHIHASVTHKAFYGLNVTNSVVLNNTGNGVYAANIRDRTALCNVSIEGNQGIAGLLVQNGAADIWVNDTSLSYNWGDGVNISFTGGAINLNSSRIVGNRWRGFAYHHNSSSPFWALRHEIIVKGRPANNIFYPEMIISDNLWGGLLIGNICVPALYGMQPKVMINWVDFKNNAYHPAMELFTCQQNGVAAARVDISGNNVLYGSAMGLRIEPCVNALVTINSNRFQNIRNSAMLIRNARHPQLMHLPAEVHIYKNDMKMNVGVQFVASIGLNENALRQRLIFDQQNEIRMNTVINPFPFLKARSVPYAALVVSSSNVLVQHNCLDNPNSDYEIATDLMEHAKRIDASNNNWGNTQPHVFMPRIFDQFNRYSLAQINIDPFSAVCNHRRPTTTFLQHYYRSFRQKSESSRIIGGAIYENSDLPAGTYTVVNDLHITPGAKLTLASGTKLEFMDGVGMLVQGELLRGDYLSPLVPVIFTRAPFRLPKSENLRLVDEMGNSDVIAGRLEVRLDDGQWGTVCNRSWTVQLTQLACNQLGLTMDPQYFENWRIFPHAGDLPIRMDNIRCEEREYDLTKCRHDGDLHNAASPLSCRPSEVVGIRCAVPSWAGVRYSLLASPPSITGQATMHNWIIERAGLFDFRNSIFCPALQIDWNYHVFNGLIIRNNFQNGLEIIYNDLTKKPAVRRSSFKNNRRNGIVIRSNGVTIEKVTIQGNGNAGIHYNSRIDASLQQDIASWLDGREQPELEANNIYSVPPTPYLPQDIQYLYAKRNGDSAHPFGYSYSVPSGLSLARNTVENPPAFAVDSIFDSVPKTPCSHELTLQAVGHQFGLEPKLAIQIVHRWHNESDEDIEILNGRKTSYQPTSVRRNTIEFPILSSGPSLRLKYSRSFGPPSIVLLVLFLDAQEYLDRFVHVYESTISDNQYGVSATYYNNLTMADDGAIIVRNVEEKLWFQKVNFTRNSDAVLWLQSPQHEILPNTPIAKISWHIDNCSIVDNTGFAVDMHRDLFGGANLFLWNFWSNTFANNSNAGINIQLPDFYNPLLGNEHRFLMTENRFESNKNFSIHIHGYYAFANISSNNFTDNVATNLFGIMELSGMEKYLIMERNRFFNNKGAWMIRVETLSQSLRDIDGGKVPGFIQYNYFQFNHFLTRLDDYVDMWPRSYAVGIFGTQMIDVHFNRFRNILMDFELIAGCTPQFPGIDAMNVSFNWWGVANEAEVSQRIFDLDDWNIYTVAQFSPYYTTEELFINFWWNTNKGQLSFANYTEPGSYDLKGRIFQSKTLTLDAERWHPFPYYYRPFRPYRITRDLTIMPGATLTIERNVEVHVWPNVRILVLGDLIADGTLWQPIRFRPINVTEYAQQHGLASTRYRRDAKGIENLRYRSLNFHRTTGQRWRHRERRMNLDSRFARFVKSRQLRSTLSEDIAEGVDVYRQFPELRRENPSLQKFSVWLTENGTVRNRSGFLSYYNETTGEFIPSCDRRFTLRNAQVVCRELGFDTSNAYHWLTPRWEYNPLVRIIKTYVEPRECRGIETRLKNCELRLSGPPHVWQCVDSMHFNYIHCGESRAIPPEYHGHWGGITFAPASLEYVGSSANKNSEDISILRHVEIVGGGMAHGDPVQSAALQIIARAPKIENVNVTNSAMHGIQIVMPTDNIVTNRVNVSENRGQGLSIVSANLHSQITSNAEVPQGTLNIPYAAPGILNICSSGKTTFVNSRIILYYKYDSLTVDCVKIFSLPKSMQQQRGAATANSIKTIGFRFLQVNFNKDAGAVGRTDSLSIYAGKQFAAANLLHRYSHPSFSGPSAIILPTSSPGYDPNHMAIHLRATGADGQYGFIAEVFVAPSAPSPKNVEEVTIRDSRIIRNDRGGIYFRNVGEIGPAVVAEQVTVYDNGYYLFGNVSTSSHAVEFHLHNTVLFLFRSNSVCNNQGGMLVMARSSSSVAQLNGIIKGSAFIGNSNSTTLALVGNDYQKITLLNNVIAHNIALYFDTVLVSRVTTNFTSNLFFENVGLHTVDTFSPHIMTLHHPSISSTVGIIDFPQSTANEGWQIGGSNCRHHFVSNFFDKNLALGHDYQYIEAFGYLPPDAAGQHGRYDEFRRRPRRQVLTQQGVSFDWWTHAADKPQRYRSTVFIGSSIQQIFHNNIFNDPENAYELTTSVQTEYDAISVDARENYWGFPSTAGVAAGKIRDKSDFPGLARVDFLPVLESNTSLIEGDCPAGWFQVGEEEFKSCLLFIAASMTYADAIASCERMDAFMPVLRTDDNRQREIAARIDALGRQFVVDVERYNSYAMSYDIPLWISSVALPSHQCGWMSSRTASIGEQNCNNLLPFVCEKGTRPYQEPIMWRQDITLAAITFIFLSVALLSLGLLALCKSQRRKENFATRKAFVRDSIRHSKSRSNEKYANNDGNRDNTTGNVQLKRFAPLSKTNNEAAPNGVDLKGSTISETTYESCLTSNDTSTELSTSCDYSCAKLPTKYDRVNVISLNPNGSQQSHRREYSSLDSSENNSSYYCQASNLSCSTLTHNPSLSGDSTLNASDATYCSCYSSRSSSSKATTSTLLARPVVRSDSNRQIKPDVLRTSSRPDFTERNSSTRRTSSLSREKPLSTSNPNLRNDEELIYANLDFVGPQNGNPPKKRSNELTSLETCM